MSCATSALGISWQHFNHPNLFLGSVYGFHGYFHVRIIVHDLSISFPYEANFSKVKNPYIKSVYCNICDDYGVNADETWVNGYWFCTTKYGVFGDGGKATERSSPDNRTRWIITQYDGFTRKGIGKISRSVESYVYLVLTS